LGKDCRYGQAGAAAPVVALDVVGAAKPALTHAVGLVGAALAVPFSGTGVFAEIEVVEGELLTGNVVEVVVDVVVPLLGAIP
jgi:hypothetical protein